MDFLQRNAIAAILWLEPSLKTIENMWDILGPKCSRIVSSIAPGMAGNRTTSDPSSGPGGI